jgi:hypothetical protein
VYRFGHTGQGANISLLSSWPFGSIFLLKQNNQISHIHTRTAPARGHRSQSPSFPSRRSRAPHGYTTPAPTLPAQPQTATQPLLPPILYHSEVQTLPYRRRPDPSAATDDRPTRRRLEPCTRRRSCVRREAKELRSAGRRARSWIVPPLLLGRVIGKKESRVRGTSRRGREA